jgi:hypothetical protein
VTPNPKGLNVDEALYAFEPTKLTYPGFQDFPEPET